MTQQEFTQRKLEGLKQQEIDCKKKILQDFDGELDQYFNGDGKHILIDNPMLFSPKQMVEIIKEKYPDLKLNARHPVCHFGCTIDSKIKIFPKKKVTILFWQVWK
jgi:hypothetical protein